MAFQGLKNEILSDARFGMMFDHLGNVVSASSNIQKLFGYRLPELLSKNYGDLLQAGSKAATRTGFSRLWALPHKERYYYRSSVTFKDKDGVDLPGVIQSKFVSKDESTLLFSTFSAADNTGDDIEEEPSLLREYPFVLQVNRDGICLEASAVRRRPYSRPRSEIIGKSFVSFMKESVVVRQSVLTKLQENKHFQLIDKKFERIDGVTTHMDVFFMPNFNKAGECTDYACFAVNHESLARHEQQFALQPTT
jgi:PAS domain S-box-containing protein